MSYISVTTGATEKIQVHDGTLLAQFCSALANAGRDRTARRVGPTEGSSGSTEGGQRWPTRRAISWERSPLRVHHTDSSSVVIDVICRSNSAITGIPLNPAVHTRSVLYWRILAQLRREEPRYVFGRRCSGGSEWRTQLSLIGSLGFSLPRDRGKEGSMASLSRAPPLR